MLMYYCVLFDPNKIYVLGYLSLSPSLPPSLPLQRWGVFSHSFPARCACLFIKGKVSTRSNLTAIFVDGEKGENGKMLVLVIFDTQVNRQLARSQQCLLTQKSHVSAALAAPGASLLSRGRSAAVGAMRAAITCTASLSQTHDTSMPSRHSR